MRILKKKEVYTLLLDAINKELGGTKISNAPKDFAVTKTMYYNITSYIKGALLDETKLYSTQKLNTLLKHFNISNNIIEETFFVLS